MKLLQCHKVSTKQWVLPEMFPRNVREPVIFQELLIKYGWKSGNGGVEKLKRWRWERGGAHEECTLLCEEFRLYPSDAH